MQQGLDLHQKALETRAKFHRPGTTSGLQQKRATLSDGAKLLAICNADTKLATFDRRLGTSTYKLRRRR